MEGGCSWSLEPRERRGELRAKEAKSEAWGEWWGAGGTAASSVELWAAEEGAELGTFHPRAQETHPSPQSSRGQRKAITSLVFVAAQRVGVGGSAISARGGLAGSSGRKVTVRPKSAQGRRGPPQSAEGLAWVGGEWCGAPAHCQGPWERLSPQRAGEGGRAQQGPSTHAWGVQRGLRGGIGKGCRAARRQWPDCAHSRAPSSLVSTLTQGLCRDGGGTLSFSRTFPEDQEGASLAVRSKNAKQAKASLSNSTPLLLPAQGWGSPRRQQQPSDHLTVC